MPRLSPSPEQVEEAMRKAGILKRVEPADLLQGENEPTQFGNNFYLLFLAMMRKEKNPDDVLVRVYLNRAEALGEPWKQFLSNNDRLLVELEDALREEQIYAHISGLFRDFFVAGDFDGGKAFDKRFHPELGINVIGIPIWRRLSSALRQAAAAMRECGIDASQFYG